MNLIQIKYIYDNLNHNETEIRVFGSQYPYGKSVFVKSKERFC